MEGMPQGNEGQKMAAVDTALKNIVEVIPETPEVPEKPGVSMPSPTADQAFQNVLAGAEQMEAERQQNLAEVRGRLGILNSEIDATPAAEAPATEVPNLEQERSQSLENTNTREVSALFRATEMVKAGATPEEVAKELGIFKEGTDYQREYGWMGGNIAERLLNIERGRLLKNGPENYVQAAIEETEQDLRNGKSLTPLEVMGRMFWRPESKLMEIKGSGPNGAPTVEDVLNFAKGKLASGNIPID